jgi:excisionase family DNA binding protein
VVRADGTVKSSAEGDPMKKEKQPTALLKPEEVAEMLRVARKTVIVMARDGRIPSLRVGRFVRFDAAEVEHWLNDQRR